MRKINERQDMANYGHIIFFSLIGGVFSLVGGMLLLRRKKTAETLGKYATPFAAGALLAAAFFELLPEALEVMVAGTAMRWVLGGIIAFFLLEHFLHWFHHHHEHQDKSMHVTAPLIIIGDSVHNLLDGIAIGAAFLISVPAGIVAAIAVATHEIPQEIGDFGLLLKQGYNRQKVIIINVLSALMSTVGALLIFWLGSESALPLGEMLAITAGMFIYIAASDLIPTIHQTFNKKYNYAAVALLLLGILTVGVTTEIAHKYTDANHGDQNHNCVQYFDKEGEHLIYADCVESFDLHEHGH